RPDVEVRGRARGDEQGVEVQVLLRDRGDVVERGGRLPSLGRGHETEVAGGHVHGGIAWQNSPDGDPDGLDGAAGLVTVAWGARLVEHHADDVEGGVDRRESVDARGHRAGGRGDVDGEHHRGAGQGRDVRARGEAV